MGVNAKLADITAATSPTGGELIYIEQGGNSRRLALGAVGAKLLDDTGYTGALTSIGVTAQGRALLDDTGQTQSLTTLGGGTTGIALFKAATDDAAIDVLNVFTPSYTSAVARTLRSKLEAIVTPEDFGAAGDGVTDDATAIQAAIDYCATNGFTLEAGPYDYLLNSQITQSSKAVSIRGAGRDLTRFIFNNTGASSSGFAFTFDPYAAGPPNTWDPCHFSDFTIVADGVLVEPALSLSWTSRVANANRAFTVERVSVIPDTFGTDRFSKGLYVDLGVNGDVNAFRYVGDSSMSSPGIELNACLGVNITVPDISYASVAIDNTDTATLQFEGISIIGGFLYNVSKGVRGIADGSGTSVDVRVIGVHISAVAECVWLAAVSQWQINSGLFYMQGAGTTNGRIVYLATGSNSGFMSMTELNNNTAATGVAGVEFDGNSSNCTFAPGIKMSSVATGYDNTDAVTCEFLDTEFVSVTTEYAATNGFIRKISQSVGSQLIPTQPAFMAYLASATSNDKTGDGTAYTLTGFTEVFDQGADYDGTNFTAPVTGRYRFDFSVELANLGAGHTRGYVELVTSNRTYFFGLGSPGAARSSSNEYSIGGSVLADMDASDTAFLRATVSGSTLTVGIAGGASVLTVFSGSLVC